MELGCNWEYYSATKGKKKVLLRNAEDEAIRGRSINRVTRLKREINDLLSKEEKMWKQRSRVLWLHEGDKIPNISIVKLLTGITKIELRNLKTIWVRGAWMRMA